MKKQEFQFNAFAVPSSFNFTSGNKSAAPSNKQSKVGHSNANWRNAPGKPYKGHASRLDADLREQNQVLQASVGELKINVQESDHKAKQLEVQCRALQEEKSEMKKQLESCMLLLVAGNVDPVLGERIAETVQEKERERAEVLSVSRGLLNEAVGFSQKVCDYNEQLGQLQQKTEELKCIHQQHQEDRTAFTVELEELQKELEEVDTLLMEEI